jgi:hypothetical protein
MESSSTAMPKSLITVISSEHGFHSSLRKDPATVPTRRQQALGGGNGVKA